eukprot:2347732-Amphidinium_carterae.1
MEHGPVWWLGGGFWNCLLKASRPFVLGPRVGALPSCTVEGGVPMFGARLKALRATILSDNENQPKP